MLAPPSRPQTALRRSLKARSTKQLQEKILPAGWLDLIRQVLLFAGAYMSYSVVRAVAEVNNTVPFDHASEIIHLERSLHIFVEPAIQSWAMSSHALMDIASWLYVNAQTTVAITALVYIYLRHNKAYYPLRNRLVISMLIALIGYVVFPTAPPRFLPEWGFVDTVANLTSVTGAHGSASMTGLVNPYAAVPSMHVAFALMIGWQLARLVRFRALKVFWALYPLIITFVVIATANHFIFDVAMGALTAGVSAYGARRLEWLRPLAWRLRSLAAPAGAGG
ncbi:MAG TPA: phosphatase PAP2 family protein [Solirubrobacteraceae bacterium]